MRRSTSPFYRQLSDQGEFLRKLFKRATVCHYAFISTHIASTMQVWRTKGILLQQFASSLDAWSLFSYHYAWDAVWRLTLINTFTMPITLWCLPYKIWLAKWITNIIKYVWSVKANDPTCQCFKWMVHGRSCRGGSFAVQDMWNLFSSLGLLIGLDSLQWMMQSCLVQEMALHLQLENFISKVVVWMAS